MGVVGVDECRAPFGESEEAVGTGSRGARGDAYAVSIRPEHLRFVDADRTENRGSGRVLSSTSLGAMVRHRLHVGGQNVVMRELGTGSRATVTSTPR
ncbi:TOBE domain-containing protein [Streptomyces sp. NPDC086549]|uniref:TOBE domain-containing protein n=1 Tax=Streptomyces sp. NPDC086549 TaxID=3365752 RepID=UPI00381EA09D